MRFVAKYKRYRMTFQNEKVEHFATGESRELKPYLALQFDSYGTMQPHEIDAARKQFHVQGLPTEVDGVTLIDPLYRYSVFDTEIYQQLEGLDDDTRLKIEEFMLGRAECGIDYILVEEPRVAAPWPTYNDFRGVRGLPTPVAIAKKVQEDGFDVELVIAFERQNLNRGDVITELENIGATATPADEGEYVTA